MTATTSRRHAPECPIVITSLAVCKCDIGDALTVAAIDPIECGCDDCHYRAHIPLEEARLHHLAAALNGDCGDNTNGQLEAWAAIRNDVTVVARRARAAKLIRDLYEISGVGGPMHIYTDDQNLYGSIEPIWDGWSSLDAVYLAGSEVEGPYGPIPMHPANVTSGEAMTLRGICVEIAEHLNWLPVVDRFIACRVGSGDESEGVWDAWTCGQVGPHAGPLCEGDVR